MEDLELIVNPNHTKAAYIPDMIQHYPIINSKLNVLAGEESKRRFDFRLIVTNPDAISEIEENKKRYNKEIMDGYNKVVSASKNNVSKVLKNIRSKEEKHEK